METTQADVEDNEPIHHEEGWTVATSSKKRKVTLQGKITMLSNR